MSLNVSRSHESDLAVIALGVVRLLVVVILRILLLLFESRHPLLLGESINIGSNDETDKVEEWNPSMRGQELLGERQSNWAGDPANFHDGEETRPNHSPDIFPLPGTSNEGHTSEVDDVLDRRDDQVANEDLQDL